ncbi:hypothetical protein LINGRAHAP2_LOCUS22455 [Linum grandiflorum]
MGQDLTQVPLYEAEFWVHVYGLTTDFYSETVGKALCNFLGTYISSDEFNNYTGSESCIRIRVRLDIRKSLQREKNVKKPHKEVLGKFKYEKLPTFCFLYGRIGHIDRYCLIRWRFPDGAELVKLWDATLRPSASG